MKYVILVPIYNDRESLKLLIENINHEIKDLNHEISIVVINDASLMMSSSKLQNQKSLTL